MRAACTNPAARKRSVIMAKGPAANITAIPIAVLSSDPRSLRVAGFSARVGTRATKPMVPTMTAYPRGGPNPTRYRHGAEEGDGRRQHRPGRLGERRDPTGARPLPGRSRQRSGARTAGRHGEISVTPAGVWG